MMLDISECKKKKRRALLCLSGYSLVLVVGVFCGTLGTGKELVGLLLFTCWVTLFVNYEILSFKEEILKTIQDEKDNHKDTTE